MNRARSVLALSTLSLLVACAATQGDPQEQAPPPPVVHATAPHPEGVIDDVIGFIGDVGSSVIGAIGDVATSVWDATEGPVCAGVVFGNPLPSQMYAEVLAAKNANKLHNRAECENAGVLATAISAAVLNEVRATGTIGAAWTHCICYEAFGPGSSSSPTYTPPAPPDPPLPDFSQPAACAQTATRPVTIAPDAAWLGAWADAALTSTATVSVHVDNLGSFDPQGTPVYSVRIDEKDTTSCRPRRGELYAASPSAYAKILPIDPWYAGDTYDASCPGSTRGGGLTLFAPVPGAHEPPAMDALVPAPGSIPISIVHVLTYVKSLTNAPDGVTLSLYKGMCGATFGTYRLRYTRATPGQGVATDVMLRPAQDPPR